MMELAEVIARLDMDIISTTRTRDDAYAMENYGLARVITRRLDAIRQKRIELADQLTATGGDTDRIAAFRTFLDASYRR